METKKIVELQIESTSEGLRIPIARDDGDKNIELLSLPNGEFYLDNLDVQGIVCEDFRGISMAEVEGEDGALLAKYFVNNKDVLKDSVPATVAHKNNPDYQRYLSIIKNRQSRKDKLTLTAKKLYCEEGVFPTIEDAPEFCRVFIDENGKDRICFIWGLRPVRHGGVAPVYSSPSAGCGCFSLIFLLAAACTIFVLAARKYPNWIEKHVPDSVLPVIEKITGAEFESLENEKNSSKNNEKSLQESKSENSENASLEGNSQAAGTLENSTGTVGANGEAGTGAINLPAGTQTSGTQNITFVGTRKGSSSGTEFSGTQNENASGDQSSETQESSSSESQSSGTQNSGASEAQSAGTQNANFSERESAGTQNGESSESQSSEKQESSSSESQSSGTQNSESSENQSSETQNYESVEEQNSGTQENASLEEQTSEAQNEGSSETQKNEEKKSSSFWERLWGSSSNKDSNSEDSEAPQKEKFSIDLKSSAGTEKFTVENLDSEDEPCVIHGKSTNGEILWTKCYVNGEEIFSGEGADIEIPREKLRSLGNTKFKIRYGGKRKSGAEFQDEVEGEISLTKTE